jgi:hypothetical protein
MPRHSSAPKTNVTFHYPINFAEVVTIVPSVQQTHILTVNQPSQGDIVIEKY